MSISKSKEGPFFTVALDGLNLSDEQLKNIELGIKDVVMREVAKIDHRGDLIINANLALNPRLQGIKLPELFGIWIENMERFKVRQSLLLK
jgi:hypothetical protein